VGANHKYGLTLLHRIYLENIYLFIYVFLGLFDYLTERHVVVNDTGFCTANLQYNVCRSAVHVPSKTYDGWLDDFRKVN